MGLKLSYISGFLSQRGAGLTSACQSYAKHLHSLGHDIQVFGQWDASFNEDQVHWSGARLHALKSCGPSSVHYLPTLKSELLRQPTDLLHLHGLWTHWSVDGFRWQQKTQRPYVISAHGMLERWALAKSGWKKKIALMVYERRHLAKANALHAVAQQEVQDYLNLGLKAPIHLITNGVDIPQDPCFSQRRKTVLYLARIQEKKGILPLLHGWAQAHARHQGWRLQLAGWDEGGCESRARHLAAELQIEASVDWLGPVHGEDKWKLLASSGAFILPSYSEGLPMAVLEAWAHGVPTLLSSGCNLPEAHKNGAALLSDPDSQSIASALQQLANMSEADRIGMAARGHQYVKLQYDARRTALQLETLYHKLCSNSAG